MCAMVCSLCGVCVHVCGVVCCMCGVSVHVYGVLCMAYIIKVMCEV